MSNFAVLKAVGMSSVCASKQRGKKADCAHGGQCLSLAESQFPICKTEAILPPWKGFPEMLHAKDWPQLKVTIPSFHTVSNALILRFN
jgi:hypothetical protein